MECLLSNSEFGFLVTVFEVAEVFKETVFKSTTCLTNIFHVARGACLLIDPTVFVFIFGMLVPHCKKFTYCIISGKGDFDLGVLAYLTDGSCLFIDVCKFGPLGFPITLFLFFFFGVQGS
jgi:hypothetical protein